MNNLGSFKIEYYTTNSLLLFFVLIIFVLFPFKSSTQVENARFRHITLEDGLSNSLITCIYQDMPRVYVDRY